MIHKNMTPERQAWHVAAVKKYASGVVSDPITVSPDKSVREVLEITRGNNISGLPVEENGRLLGIVTNRDLRFETHLERPVREVMTPEKRLVTVGENPDEEEVLTLLHKHRIEKVLVVDENFQLKGLITAKDFQKASDFPRACKDRRGALRVGAAVGAGADTEQRAALLSEAGADVLVVDTAHGHSRGVIERVAWLRKNYPDMRLIAGNVVSGEGAEALIEAGVDGVKAGVGPGSICTTRIVAGVGVPQITAVAEVASAAARHDVPVIADGGVRYSGRHRQGTRRRSTLRHDRQPVCRNRGSARRRRALPGTQLQVVSRHGLARRYVPAIRVFRPLPAGLHRAARKAGARGYRRTSALQGQSRDHRAATDRRIAGGHGLHGLCLGRGTALASQIRAYHRGGHKGKPCARRHDHQGGPQLSGSRVIQGRILILDFGSQTTQLIARRIREAGVYSEILPWDIGAGAVREFAPDGVVLSGGPQSVTGGRSPRAPRIVFELGKPVLGICYGMQTMAQQLGGSVELAGSAEFGPAEVRVIADNALLSGLSAEAAAGMDEPWRPRRSAALRVCAHRGER